MRAIRVAVVEEREIFRRGVTVCLEEDPRIQVVHSSSGGEVSEEVDLVVASRRAASTSTWEVPVVVCVERAWKGAESAQNQVCAVLPTGDLEPKQLIGAVHAVAAGLRIEGPTAPDRDLDIRQVAVLGMLATGAATRDISEELGYSERTIKTVIQGIGEYLDARTRAEAVAKAIRLGII